MYICLKHTIDHDQSVKQQYNQLAGSATKNVTKLGLASERIQEVERSQLRKLLSSDDFNRQRGVAMSINVTISRYLQSSPLRQTLRK